MIMVDYIAKSFLIINAAWFVFLLVTIGFIWFDRRIFYHAICLAFLSILINVALKVSFQIPLAPSLHQIGFAFPSGHMQFSSTFYLWFFLQTKSNWLRALILILLAGVAWGMIHFGFHNLTDVLAGLFFALLTLFFYCYLNNKWPEKLPWLLLSLATLLLIYINLRVPMAYVWERFYGLWGIVVGEYLVSTQPRANQWQSKLVASFFLILGSALIYLVFNRLIGFEHAAYIFNLKWFLVSLLLPLCTVDRMKLSRER